MKTNKPNVVCERIIEDQQIVVKLYTPTLTADGSHWNCLIEIEGPEEVISKEVKGVDGLQALVQGVKTLESHIKLIDDKHGSNLFWNKEVSDLSLPI